MVELGFGEMLSIAQTIGIVGTMVLTLFFSKKQIQSLSIDTQTRGLNDLDEKFHKMAEIIMEDPPMGRVIDIEGKASRELAFSFYILWICSHAYAMRRRKVLDDNEWAGWLQWMRNCFRKGTIGETWKQLEQDRWFNPDFQNFINTEIIGANEIRTQEWTNYYEKLDALTIYAKEGNAAVKKVIQSLSKIDPENHKAITS